MQYVIVSVAVVEVDDGVHAKEVAEFAAEGQKLIPEAEQALNDGGPDPFGYATPINNELPHPNTIAGTFLSP